MGWDAPPLIPLRCRASSSSTAEWWRRPFATAARQIALATQNCAATGRSSKQMSEQPQSLAEISEVELVRRAQAHDDAAFQELMRRTKSSSMRLALSILKNREEAEDQVQNSFLNAWKNLGSFHLEAKFSTWMRTIVSNQ